MYLGLLGGAERGSRPSQGDLNLSCERVRAAHHAPRNPCRVFERCHGLTEVVERGAAVQERPPVIPPHLEREFITITENASNHGNRFAQQRLGFSVAI